MRDDLRELKELASGTGYRVKRHPNHNEYFDVGDQFGWLFTATYFVVKQFLAPKKEAIDGPL